MLTEATKARIRTHLAEIGRAMPNFRSRPGQRIMIAEVANTLATAPAADEEGAVRPETGANILCVNGGTGIGKSLAYTLPGFVLAQEKGVKLILATATVALQEQLVTKDLPIFLKASGIEATVALAKGRTRYICVHRLDQVDAELQQGTLFGAEQRAGRDHERNEAARKLVATLREDYAAKRWDGDRDTRPGIDETLWRALTTDRHSCLGKHCPKFRECAQAAARSRIKDAQIVVANLDLLLADLAMGGGRILPGPDKCFLVIDEAHHLPEKAVQAFSFSHLTGAGRRLVQRLAELTRSLDSVLDDARRAALADAAQALADHLEEAHQFFASLAPLQPKQGVPRPVLDFKLSSLPDEVRDLGGNICGRCEDALKILDGAGDALTKRLGGGIRDKLTEKLLADVGYHYGRTEEIHHTWSLFLEEPALEAPPIAKWVTTISLRNGLDYEINASPVVAGPYLRRALWERAAGVILTSATMTSLGSFDDFLRRSGLAAYPAVRCVDLPSPFDYARQATLEIPRLAASPKDPEGHTREVGQRVIDLIGQCQGGMLVLFTSRRQMDAVAAMLPPALRPRVQVQGEGSKAALIAEHKARVDRGETAVIFGMDSMAEGVDLAGRYCTQVVVAKLPFAVPDDPILRTLSDWIETRGGEPFAELIVPEAGRKLAQAVGRLIRTEQDQGTVTVLDPRLWSTGYGRRMLRGLPPFRVVAMGREVAP